MSCWLCHVWFCHAWLFLFTLALQIMCDFYSSRLYTWEKKMEEDNIAVSLFILIIIASAILRIRLDRRPPGVWSRSWIRRRARYCTHHSLIKELSSEDPELSSEAPNVPVVRLTRWAYSIPILWRPLSSSSSSTMFKHLLLWNRFANQSQILCGASLGRGNESLYKWSRSHDQDGRHAHI